MQRKRILLNTRGGVLNLVDVRDETLTAAFQGSLFIGLVVDLVPPQRGGALPSSQTQTRSTAPQRIVAIQDLLCLLLGWRDD